MNDRDELFDLPLFPPKPDLKSHIDVSSQHLTKDIQQRLGNFSVNKAQQKLINDNEETWLRRGEKRALALFHAVAQFVPAYKDFLAKNNIKTEKIKTIKDFQNIPTIDKENYLRAYPLEALTWYGNLPANHIVSVSSGSSGKPFFWPRGQILDAETMLEHELLLSSFFEVDKHSTLFIVCFAMGMYVAGPITMNSVIGMNNKGYPISVATPGYSPEDVMKIIPELAAQYDQIVLAGYPPYIKEIIDKGIQQGVNWKDIKLRFLLAGEGFNESWRTYVAELSGGKSPVHDFLNLYGSADAAVLGFETASSIIVRRRIADDVEARVKLFDSERLPSFLQYLPEHKFFEKFNNELIFTAPGGIPLVRYNIHDSGKILTRQDILDALPELKEYFAELEREHKLWNLPFVYVFGKSDQTVFLYGANIYPENIRLALESDPLKHLVSGKMIMHVELDDTKDQRFHIDIECMKNHEHDHFLNERIATRIQEVLLVVNSEYKVTHTGLGEKTKPIINLFPFGSTHFQSGKIKHTWANKTKNKR